ncbi:CapA family protein [Paenibacillus radicis (ex Gao et al. 2016)]|nr:CapA family protein [Paenibacillus radicis (ex Gao et al. 2016)]
MRRKRQRKPVFLSFILLLLAAAGVSFIIIATLMDDTPAKPANGQVAETASPGDKHPDTTSKIGIQEPEAAATPPPTVTPSPSPSVSPSPSPSPEPAFIEAEWVAVGDVMMHKPQVPGAYDAKTKTYNFNSYFTEVKPILSQGDWVLANLETPVAGSSYGYTGYPSFNSPVELLDALEYAGFNILTTANNHSLDKGGKGLLRTLDNLKKYKFAIKGTAASQAEADKNVIIEKNGIKMGLLSYTYGTNGIPLPQGKPYMVSLIDEKKMVADIAKTKAAGADFVTIALHFGIEYQTQPNDEQKRLARKLVAAGADIIAGSHPHVIQPYEVLETTDEAGKTRQGLIIYSMGNFISNQRDDTKDYGIIYKVLIRKNIADHTIQFGEIEAIPTWVHRYQPDNNYRYRILPVEQTLEAFASGTKDVLLSTADYNAMENTLKQLRKRLSTMK